MKATLFAAALPVAVATFTPPAAADPGQFPSLSDYATVDAADYRTYRAYLTIGLQFETPGGYRCRMSFTHKQNGAYMQCRGTLPGTPNNHVESSLLAGANLASAAFSTIDLSKMDIIPPGADGTGGTLSPENYRLLPQLSKVIFTDGPLQMCGVDRSMTACELVDGGQRHGFVLSPQGSWTF